MDNKQLPQQAENTKPKVSIDNATVKDSSVVKDIWNYLMREVFIPNSKEIMRNLLNGTSNMFANAAGKAIDRVIYPDGGAPKRNYVTRDGEGTYTTRTGYKTTLDKPRSINSRSSTEVKYIWVDTEEEAKAIIGALVEDIDNYGKAKVSTLYEMVHETPNFTDFKFGWTNANDISYYRDGSKGYFIDLPKPVNIENV